MPGLYFRDPQILERLHRGPLGGHIDAFAAFLTERRYKRSTGRGHLALVSKLSHWLERRHLAAGDLDLEMIDEFLKGQRRHVRRRSRTILGALVQQLRDAGVMPPTTAASETPVDQLESAFARHLTHERGLSPLTLAYYLPIAGRFLAEKFPATEIRLDAIGAEDVIGFVVRHARDLSPGRAKLMVTVLRAFLRFLRQRGDICVDLAACVPTVADWRLTSVPKSMEPGQVDCLLRHCDRQTSVGRRDYAILLLLARLGLRAREVVDLTLDDVNWAAGEISVHGKGARHHRLPLPRDVGAALVDYLRHGRPHGATRKLFVTTRAPRRGFSSSVAVSTIVRRALDRANLRPPRRGAHLLRHTLATHMLRQGATLAEIGKILRHRHPDTTSIYAKVDLSRLQQLALPWPGGGA